MDNKRKFLVQLIEKLKNQVSDREIAIIGVTGRYPRANTLEAFWNHLKNGTNCISEIPADRWNWQEHYDHNAIDTQISHIYSKWGGFLADVDKFDPLFFNISPRDAQFMDPQERLFLETVWALFEDAGYTRQTLTKLNHQVGTFVGVMNNNYEWLGAEATAKGLFTPARSAYWSIANRVSYYFDLTGPSLAIDTACSSSLTAIHLACDSLKKGECQMAIAGGVNLILHPMHYYRLCFQKMLASDDRCKSFGEGADGFVDGEGIGAILLKPLQQAIKDKDTIYGVIKGSSINAGGKTSGYTVPNPNAQTDLIVAALNQAQIDPRTISYVEAHGTGTSLGDPIEITGLMKAYQAKTKDTQYCSIGSVKSNIGHLESAAGIAALTKVLLQMKYKQLVPSLHSERLNPKINFKESPFYVQQTLAEWKQPVIKTNGEQKRYPRLAAISSFGAGGANAHLIVEEYVPPVGEADIAPQGDQLIVLSAKNEDRLHACINNILAFLKPTSILMNVEEEADLRQQIQQDLLKVTSDILKVSDNEIDLDEAFSEYGFDTVSLTQLSHRLNDKYHVSITSALLSEQGSLETVAQYLCDNDQSHAHSPETIFTDNRQTLFSLADFAYTLQVGREAMAERLAMVVSDLNEVKEKLTQYVQGQTEIEGFYRGNIKTHQTQSELLIEGEEGQDFLKSIIKRRKLSQLAQMWVSGVDIDWQLLYPNQKPQRISLPTYPFARERYWIPVSEPKTKQVDRVSAAKIPVTTQYYQSVWEKSELYIQTPSQTPVGKVLLFDTNEGLGLALKEQLTKVPVILVKPGTRYSQLSNQTYCINPEQPEDYVQLLTRLQFKNLLPDTILHLWSVGTVTSDAVWSQEPCEVNPENDSPALVLSEQLRGIYSCYYLIKALSELKMVSSLFRFLFIFEPQKVQNPFLEAVSGYSKSLAFLWPKLSFSTVQIDFQDHDEKAVVDILWQELNCPERNWVPEIRYQEGQRESKQIKPLELKETKVPPLPKQGVYLITGGLGGLGLLLTSYLASRYQARLVLTGRSPLTSQKDEFLKELRQRGASVLYLQADVADESAMTNVIKTVKEQYGQLNGVIHAAGTTSDQLITQKKESEFELTLSPKIQGTIILDKVTEKEPLDFFVMFSSTSAILGDFGQCDYAIANRFLDSYAQLRESYRVNQLRQGQTISINWPLWKEGGMHLSKEAESLYIQFSGMSYLETANGLKAFEEILSNKHSHVMLMVGDPNRIESFLLPRKTTGDDSVYETVQKFTPIKNTGKAIERQIESDIKNIASELLKINPQQLDVSENLGYFGFDSISLKEFAEKLSDTFSVELSPSVFFAHSSIQSLSTYLLEEFSEPMKDFYVTETETPPLDDSYFEYEAIPQKEPHAREKENQIDTNRGSEAIAIIGTHGIFPDSRDLSTFWHHLETEHDLITEVPIDRWDWREYYGDPAQEPNKTNSKWGGFVPEVDKFDPLFFKLSPREAEMMDPQHRLFIESVWKAIEDAGYQASQLSGKAVGVFVGVQFNDYQQLLLANQGETNAQAATGNAHAMLANRVSFLLNLRGPSEAIDTACSSSLVAIHQAVKSIRTGESELAIAGGVSLMLSPEMMIGASQLGVLSPDGKCKTFDKNANGYVKGEGVAAILLKPLQAAIADKDNIQAVIKGTAVNHGGKATSLTAPNSNAQAALLTTAYLEAGITPDTVTYLELHGTGTELGDPVEVEGLKMAFKKLASKQQRAISQNHFCGLGSVKTNIGHLEPAAGIAGLLKVILAMLHQKLPGTLHLQTLNPHIELKDTPFYVVEKTQTWNQLKDEKGHLIPRRAGVSSFGFGGANAHVVLEEYESPESSVIPRKIPQLFVLSAKNEERLSAYAQEIRDFLTSELATDVVEPQVTEKVEFRLQVQQNYLLKVASEILKVSDNEIDLDEALSDLGFDTVSLTELSHQLNDKYFVSITPALLSEYQSLAAVAQYLCDNSQAGESTALKNPKANFSLAELAYTLQVGREAMEERLAMVAFSVDDLKDKLTQYAQGQTEIDDFYRGNVKSRLAQSELLIEGEEGKDFVNSIIKNRKLTKLAHLWVSGVEIDWQLLYGNQKPQRISLPTYPFARERYWVPEQPTKRGNLATSTGAPIETLSFRPERQARPLPSETPIKSETIYFQAQWQSQSLELRDLKNDPILLLGSNQALVEQLQQETQVIWAKPGNQFEQTLPNQYALDLQDASHYQQMIQSLADTPQQVVYCLEQTIDNSEISARYLLPLIYLCRALIEQKASVQLLIIGVFRSDSLEFCLSSAFSGFGKTLEQESSRFMCKTVVAEPPLDNLATLIRQELQLNWENREVRYAADQRQVKTYQPFLPPETTTVPLRQHGVYLITGGLGGLGLIFATYLAKNYQARLILTGRSALSAAKTQQLETLKRTGAEIQYFQCDIAQTEAVAALVKQIQTQYGILHGILHCAGVIKDAHILNKTPEQVSQVLAPKVAGTIALDQATEPQDFLVLFSSIAAIVGNVGQSDYAFANAFMDAFVQYRDKPHTLSINWPLWKTGGMQITDEAKQLLYHTKGIIPLEEKAGIQALLNGLSLDIGQLIVMQGDADKIQHQFTQETKPTTLQSIDTLSMALRHKIEDSVLTKIASIVKVNPKEIEPTEEMSQYGLDSIMLTEVTNQLNLQYQLDLTPAILYEYSTFQDFANYLAETYGSNFAAHYQESLPTRQEQTSAVVQKPITKIQPRKKPVVDQEPIAIVGIGGIMPSSPDLDSFWQHLAAGDDLIQEIPKERWDWKAIYGDGPNKTLARWGGFMDEVDQFDALFFGISPKEARFMDPQQRLFLQTVWQAIENAGIRPSSLSGSQTGLFVGVTHTDYLDLIKTHAKQVEPDVATGLNHTILANRVSYRFNLHGPSEPINTACSSSLIAIHRAVNAIHHGECEMAIAGGVQVILDSMVTLALSKGGMLSKDGRCKTFDKSANGFVRGEGVGAILLKPLSQAQADGNPIYAVIRGTAENHGGHAKSLTSPNPNAQANLLVKAYEKANISPETVSYIEAHGTGTSLGDPIEINGLKKAFAALYQKWGLDTIKTPHCGLGSVKTNIGHLESAAGIAGILKVLLMMQHKTLPVTLHLKELNPYIKLQDSPFYIVDSQRAWEPLSDEHGQAIPRRAGVSSFGFGGSNAHVVLEEYPQLAMDTSSGPQIIVLSAKNADRLTAYAKKLASFLKQPSPPALANIAWTLQTGREAMEERLALVVDSLEQLTEKLAQFIQPHQAIEGLYQANIKKDKNRTHLLLEGEAGKAYMDIIMQTRDFAKLANLWVTGIDIDWALLYPNGTPNLVPLPTYPFAKKRYWISDVSQRQTAQQTPVAKPKPVPAKTPAKQETLPPARMDDQNKASRVLLLSSNQALAEHLQRDIDIIRVEPGNNFQQMIQNQPTQIIYCLSETDDTRETQLQPLDYLNQVLKTAKQMIQLLIVIPTYADQLREAFLDYGNTLQQSNPQFLCKTVMIQNQLDSEWLAKMLKKELQLATLQDCDVRYQDGQRQVKSYHSLGNPYQLMQMLKF